MVEEELPRRVALAIAIDAAVVLLFVAIGRESHDETGSAIGNILSIAAPFLIALAFGWITVLPQAPMAVPTGVAVWLTTVVCGLLLRRFMFTRGTALPFIIVTSLFLGAGLMGWRALVGWWLTSRRARRA